MFSDDKWYLLTDEERKIRHSRIKEGAEILEKASTFNAKPNAPFINLGYLKSLVKELLDKHFRKIAIMTVTSLVVSGIFTWLVWPKNESEVVREAKAQAEKMGVELQKAKEETARLAKELEQQKPAEAQNVKNGAPESKDERKEKNSGSSTVVAFGFFSGIIGIVLLMLIVLRDWRLYPSLGDHITMISLTSLFLGTGLVLVIVFWPRSETVSETVQQNSENAAKEKTTEISAEKSKSIPRKFISRATITFKESFFDKYNYNYFFYLKLDNGRKGKLRVDSKFFALVKVGEIIAIYEGDEFVPEENKEEKKEALKKKRVEY